MDVNALKLELVQNILNTEEEGVLEQIKLILDSTKGDWWEVLSEKEKAAIEEGIAQLDKGEGVGHDEVMKLVRKKFFNGDK